ncbi:MAG TPA: 5'-3' exonuclease H3TH domain-containing protein [Opitutus sp.]|nr:5'-3' exonuclease H3TH domain-containing protein [Opitutus sp.]
MAKWLLVDGYNLAYRCFFAIPELTRADGFPTNALHGWVKSLWMLADQTKPDACVVFFDLGGPQDRLALHPDYKAQREEMPEALEKQLPYVRKLTKAMGCVGVEQDGVESDDLLAAQAVALARDGHEVLIVSSDKDFAQIVNDRIKIMLPPPSANPKIGWRMMDAARVQEKFGVPPEKIADYLALVGDTSDNIPGLAGVGPKTAAKWLNEYGSLEGVIANCTQLKPERFQAAICAEVEKLRRNVKLTTLNLALPTISVPPVKPHPDELYALLEELGMKTALADARRRLGGPAPAPLGAVPVSAASATAVVDTRTQPPAPKPTQGELF